MKEAIVPDHEEQAAIISTMVRITVLGWSGAILTLNYVAIPGIHSRNRSDIIASVLLGFGQLWNSTASRR